MKITIKGTPEELAEVAKEMQLQLEENEPKKKISWHIDMDEIDAGFRKFLQDTAKSLRAKYKPSKEHPFFSPDFPISRRYYHRKHHPKTSYELTNQTNDNDE